MSKVQFMRNGATAPVEMELEDANDLQSAGKGAIVTTEAPGKDLFTQAKAGKLKEVNAEQAKELLAYRQQNYGSKFVLNPNLFREGQETAGRLIPTKGGQLFHTGKGSARSRSGVALFVLLSDTEIVDSKGKAVEYAVSINNAEDVDRFNAEDIVSVIAVRVGDESGPLVMNLA